MVCYDALLDSENRIETRIVLNLVTYVNSKS